MINRIFRKYYIEAILAIFIIIYIYYFSWFTINRNYNLYSSRYDLGNMVQTVYNSAFGRIFTMTDPAGTGTISRFAIHTDFFLALIAPIYRLFPFPETVLILQSAIISLGVLPLFLLAKKVLKNNLSALAIAVSYLFYPALQRANIYDFHAVTVVPTFILAAFYSAYFKKYPWFYLFAFLATSTKEEISLLVAAIGIYIYFKNRDKTRGALIFISGITWFIFSVWYIIPHFRQGMSHFGVGFYSDYGESPGKILLGFMKQPLKVISTVFSKNRLLYLLQLFLPAGFLPIVGLPFILMALPEWGINLLSNVTVMQSIYYQYTSGITPFIFIALIFGISFLNSRFKINKNILSIFLIIFTAAGSYFYSPLPYSKTADWDSVKFPNQHAAAVTKTEKLIPETASISVTNNIAPHFANHREFYSFPNNYNRADYAVVLAEGFMESVPLKEIKKKVMVLQNDKFYSLIFNENNLYVFKKQK